MVKYKNRKSRRKTPWGDDADLTRVTKRELSSLPLICYIDHCADEFGCETIKLPDLLQLLDDELVPYWSKLHLAVWNGINPENRFHLGEVSKYLESNPLSTPKILVSIYG